MKFTCLREDILSAVMKAEKAVSPKSTLAVMEGILIEAEIDKVYISGAARFCPVVRSSAWQSPASS